MTSLRRSWPYRRRRSPDILFYCRWLQPLDIAFNLVFKRILKEIAAKWLAMCMAEQLKMHGGDPSKVNLNVGLKVMKPLFVLWLCATLEAMMKEHNVAHNKKGWDMSKMSEAFLPEHNSKDSDEYLNAEEMAANGTLFANITGKKGGGAIEGRRYHARR